MLDGQSHLALRHGEMIGEGRNRATRFFESISDVQASPAQSPSLVRALGGSGLLKV